MESINARAAQIMQQQEKIENYNLIKKDLLRRSQAATDKSEARQDDLKALEEDSFYKDFASYNVSKEAILQQSALHEKQFLDFFNQIKPTLLKLLALSPGREDIIDYLDNPFQTFNQNDGRDLLHILQHAKALVEAGKLDTEHQVSLFLERLQSGELDQIYREHIVLQQQLSSLILPPASKNFMLKYQDIQYRQSHFLAQATALNEELESVTEKIGGIKESLARNLHMFENLVSLGIGKKISIVFPAELS